MDASTFVASRTGHLVPTISGASAFVPAKLPPASLDFGALLPAAARAALAVGELSGIGRTLQNPYLLVRPFMRKEAVASSKIEGTVTTLSELFLFEVDAEKKQSSHDAREVWNYVRALEYSLNRIKEIPLSLRLIREAHTILLAGVSRSRGAGIIPGQFKRDQNWIGSRVIQNARYVPPPPRESEICMGELEKYLHDTDDSMPLLIKLALVHYQFEAIHPFPDGNGRVGRLLIPLIMCEREEISQPLLYLSPFFENNYDQYIDLMLDVSRYGRWEAWIEFFLRAIEASARTAIATTSKLRDLQVEYHSRVQQARSSALLGQIIDLLFEHPAITIPRAAQALNIAYNAAKNNVQRLVDHGIVAQSPFDTRPRVFIANEIVSVLSH